MRKRSATLPQPGRLTRLLTGTTVTTATPPATVIEPVEVVRARAVAVLSTMPSRYIPTKTVLDTYLDTIGVGR